VPMKTGAADSGSVRSLAPAIQSDAVAGATLPGRPPGCPPLRPLRFELLRLAGFILCIFGLLLTERILARTVMSPAGVVDSELGLLLLYRLNSARMSA
jgi:hypothetical protein